MSDDFRLGLFFVAAVDNGDNGLGEVDEGEAGGGVARKGGGGACVAIVADALNEGDLGEQGYLHLLGELLAAFLAEDVIAVLGQFGGGEPRHVLDEAEDGHVDLLVAIHVDSLAGVGEGDLLGSGDDDGSGDGEGLQQREMDVAGAWRGVEDEIVELAPVGIGNELLQGAGGHAATPESGRGGGDEEADGEELDTVFLDGADEVATILLDGIGTLILYIEHLGHGGSEDVGVEQTYLVAETGEGDGEVGRDGALADASLAGTDGDDVLDAWQQLADLGAGSGLELGLDGDLDVLSAVVLDGSLGGFYRRLQEGVGVARELEHDLHLPGLAFG